MPVNVIDTLKPKNGLSFPVVEAIDVFVEDYENLADAISHFATDVMIEAINTVLSGKADAADLTALEAEVDAKADTSALTTAAANLQAQIDNLITPVTQDAEVQNARVGADGETYTTLKERLDADNVANERRETASASGYEIVHYTWLQERYDTQAGEFVEDTHWKCVFIPLDKKILMDLNDDTTMQVFAGMLENDEFIYSNAISQSIGYYTAVTGGKHIIETNRENIYIVIQIRKEWTDTTAVSAETLMSSYVQSEMAETVDSVSAKSGFVSKIQSDFSDSSTFLTEISLTADSLKNVGNIKAGKTDGYGINTAYATSDWFPCSAGDSITYVLPAETGTKTLQSIDKDGNVVTEITGTGQNDITTIQTHTFLETEFAFRICTYTNLKDLSSIKYHSVRSKNFDSMISDIFGDVKEIQSFLMQDYERKPLTYSQIRLNNDGTVSPDRTRIATDFIDMSAKHNIRITSSEGYRFVVFIFDSSKQMITKLSSWQTAPYYIPYVYFKFIRIMVSKESGSITPDEGAAITLSCNDLFCDDDVRQASLDCEKLDRSILEELAGYQILDSGMSFSKSNKKTSFVHPCFAGDKIKFRLPQETPAYTFVTYDENMEAVHRQKGDGINNYSTEYIHTFTAAEKYFQISCWSAQYRFASIEYFSQYGKLANPYASFSDETDSAVEKLKAHYTCNNQLVFGFNTDQHASAKLSAGDSESVYNGLRELSKITNIYPFNFVCLGGDAPSYNSRTVQTICDDILAVKKSAMGADCPVISICGNHDAYDNTTDITLRQLYNVHFKDAIQKNEIVPVDNFSTTGYIDFVSESIRAIFIDSNFRGSYSIDTARGYLADMLDNLPEGYKAVILSHYPLNTGMNTPPFDSKVDFNSVIETHSSDILFCVNGHAHVDSEDVVNGILYVQTTTAGKDGMSAFPQERIRDTADDTAYDIYVANLDDGVVDIIRYGSGKDRKLYYSGTLASFTFNLPENVTVSSKPHALYAGSDYHAFFKTSDEISVVITMNGVDITNSAYNPNTRSIDIIDISGNVIISVEIAS